MKKEKESQLRNPLFYIKALDGLVLPHGFTWLDSAFSWEGTNEGYHFWFTLCMCHKAQGDKKIRNALPDYMIDRIERGEIEQVLKNMPEWNTDKVCND